MTIFLPEKFKEYGPVLPDVKITETWGYYDGPLFGICEVDGVKLFFCDCIFEMWRSYSEEDNDRLWSIYSVYDVDIDTVRNLVNSGARFEWSKELNDISEVIGIFWEYTKHV